MVISAQGNVHNLAVLLSGKPQVQKPITWRQFAQQDTVSFGKALEPRFEIPYSGPVVTKALKTSINAANPEWQGLKDMTSGENMFPTPKAFLSAFHSANRHYLNDFTGELQAKAVIAKAYSDDKTTIKPENVLISAGTYAAASNLFNAVKGDILIPAPSWYMFEPMVASSNKKHTWVAVSKENNYIPTPKTIQAAIQQAKAAGQDPKILALTNPHNPTGGQYTKQQCQEIADVCRKEGLTVISDEIYRNLLYPGTEFHSVRDFYPEGTMLISGPSKEASMPGWRIGWTIFPETNDGEALRDHLNRYQEGLGSMTNSPAQSALMNYFESSDIQEHVQRVTALHAQRMHTVQQGLTKLGLEVPKPDAGYFLYVDFEPLRPQLAKVGVKTSADLQQYLYEKKGIVAIAGSDMGLPKDSLGLRVGTSKLDAKNDASGEATFKRYAEAGFPAEGFVTPKTQPELFAFLDDMTAIVDELKK